MYTERKNEYKSFLCNEFVTCLDFLRGRKDGREKSYEMTFPPRDALNLPTMKQTSPFKKVPLGTDIIAVNEESYKILTISTHSCTN